MIGPSQKLKREAFVLSQLVIYLKVKFKHESSEDSFVHFDSQVQLLCMLSSQLENIGMFFSIRSPLGVVACLEFRLQTLKHSLWDVGTILIVLTELISEDIQLRPNFWLITIRDSWLLKWGKEVRQQLCYPTLVKLGLLKLSKSHQKQVSLDADQDHLGIEALK